MKKNEEYYIEENYFINFIKFISITVIIMKQKKIIQRLIEQSKYCQTEEHAQPPRQPQSKTISEDEEIFVSSNISYEFQVHIDIGDGRSDNIYINQKSDPYRQAVSFCDKHGLQPYISKLLGESLKEQSQNEKRFVESENLSKKDENKQHEVIGADKILKQSRKYSFSKNKSKEMWKKDSDFHYAPKINQISEEIVRKVGKQSIIDSVCKKSHEKIEQYLLEQLYNQEKEIKQYSFHPQVNPISKKVDQTLSMNRTEYSRYEQLYNNHKKIEEKKQFMRKSSLNEISFKPEINNLSKKIISKKKSLGQIRSCSGSKEKQNVLSKLNQSLCCLKNSNIPKTGRKPLHRNQQNIPIGDYLYQEGIRKKQKLDKAKKQAEKSLSKDNWKIIDNSESLAQHQRQNKIRQIFYSLTKPPHKSLFYKDIERKKLTEVEKIFEPVYKELKEIDTDLTEEEFVQACYRLLKYLSPTEKALLCKKTEEETKENKKVMQINRKSAEIVKQKSYSAQNIYIRGIIYKKEVKDQIQKRKEDKVRKELRNCTFKPKINENYEKSFMMI